MPEHRPANIDPEVAIGIDTGWRILQELKHETKDKLRQYAPVQIAAIAFSDGRKEYAEIHFPETLAKKANDLVRIQSELDKNATKFGRDVLPLIKGVIIPENYPGKEHEVRSKVRFLNGLQTIGGNLTLDIERAYKFANWVQFSVSEKMKVTKFSSQKL